MNKKTLFGLIICNFALFTMGNGFLPLMPVYALSMGASEEIAGLYIAFAYFCIAAGTMIGGRLSDRIANRKTFLFITSFFFAPITLLVGKVETVWQLTLCTGLQYLIAGMCLAAAGAITGREAKENERGKVFGLIGMTIGLGALAGGLTIGPMVDAWGYGKMFTAMAAFLLVVPVAIFLLVIESPPTSPSKVIRVEKKKSRMEKILLLLFFAQILGMIANGLGNMARSVSMNRLEFTGTAMTATAAIGGAVLLSMVTVSMSVGPAFVADLVKPESVGIGIALFQCAGWLGIIIGFVYSGFASRSMGPSLSLLFASGAGVIAAFLIFLLKTKSPPVTA